MESENIFDKRFPEKKKTFPVLWLILAVLFVIASAGIWYYLQITPAKPIVALGEELYEETPDLLRRGTPDFDEYWQYFRITNVQAKLAINFAGDRMVFVHGLLENMGEREVDAAEIKITFFDPQGKVLRERICAPLRPETGLKKPISSLQSRDFSVRFENWPEKMEVGQLEVLLTGMRLVPRKTSPKTN
jgi:hypothetical protein